MRKLTSLALVAAIAASVPLSSAEAWHRGRRHHDGGSAAAAGIMGLAAGAIIGGAIAQSQAQAAAARPAPPPATVDPQLAAYCARKYRSFDSLTGTYLARSGERIVCTYD